MTVRVHADEREGTRVLDYSEASSYESDGRDTLHVCGLPTRTGERHPVASFASGRWNRVENLSEPVEPAEALSFTVTVEHGGCLEGAMRRVIRALADDGGRILIDGQPVDAAAEPDPVREYRAHVEDLNRETVETTTELTATLSETSDPFVCVSVTGSDADEVLRVWRNATATTTTPAINFDWRRKPRRDDDGPAGVREPVRP